MNNEKTYIIEGLDCANCAAKVERKLQSMPQIESADLTFATKQLKIVSSKNNDENFINELTAICNSVESGVTLTAKVKNSVPAGPSSNSLWKKNRADLICLIIGSVFFAAGIIFEKTISGMFSESISIALPLIVFAISYLFLGGKVLVTSGKNIAKGQIFDENFLMSIATIAAFFIGEFTEGVGVMLFYRIGELFEHIAVEKSRNQIMDAVDMRPETVNLICEHDHGHDEHEHSHDEHEHDICCCHEEHEHEHEEHIHVVPAEKAAVGDILLIHPGDRIPLDGIITEGVSRIDTSPVTGEPVPVSVSPGASVISGCVNQQGVLKMQVEKPLSESMVTKILDSVENAAAGKPKIDKFITKFARIYTPIVVILAVLTAIIPSIVTGNWNEWITTAITFLVISCPCALVISVPLAFFAGIGSASKSGILFKGGLAIEALKNIKAVVMDKTGTLTKGDFTVQEVLISDTFMHECTDDSLREKELLSLAASCELLSTHPIAASIVDEAHRRNITAERPDKAEELSGMGIQAELKGKQVLCGNSKLMKANNITPDENCIKSDGTQVMIAVDGVFAGAIYISDTIRSDTASAINQLKASGLIPAMLTGDSMSSAKAVAEKTGITKIYAQLLPEGKLSALGEIRSETGPVMFVGDGINDAPVLAGADVGAAMGSGTDAAIEAADVIFMHSSVEAIPKSINIAKTTGIIAGENVVLALAVKLLVLILGFIGFANIWAAVFADTGVAMLCILNSLRILWKRF